MSTVQMNTWLRIGKNRKNVTIGHRAVIHACEIGDNCLIGMGAIILSGAVVGAGSILAAGSVVKKMKSSPPDHWSLGSRLKSGPGL